jgi:hypothetical protein
MPADAPRLRTLSAPPLGTHLWALHRDLVAICSQEDDSCSALDLSRHVAVTDSSGCAIYQENVFITKELLTYVSNIWISINCSKEFRDH